MTSLPHKITFEVDMDMHIKKNRSNGQYFINLNKVIMDQKDVLGHPRFDISRKVHIHITQTEDIGDE